MCSFKAKKGKFVAVSANDGEALKSKACLSMHPTHLWIIIAVTLSCYLNSLDCELVFDDIPAIVENEDVRPGTSWFQILRNDFWGTPLQKEESHKSYRPLCVLTFRLNYCLHELKPMGYHFVNVALHTIVCVLYYRLCLEFLPKTSSFVASILFAVHPIHTEAVTGVVGRAELLCAVFFLLAFLTYISSAKSGTFRNARVVMLYLVLITSAMLSKEQGITVGGVCVLYDILLLLQKKFKRGTADQAPRSKVKGPTPTWRKDLVLRLLLVFSGLAVLLLFRVKIMGGKTPVFNKFDNPAVEAVTPARQLTYNYVLSINAWLLLFPWDLCCDWTMGTVPIVASLRDTRNWATALFYISIYALLRGCWRSHFDHCRKVVMAIGLLCIPFVPASNLFFPVGFVVAERVLYIPSMGFCFCVAYGWQCLFHHCRKRRWAKITMWSCLMILLCLNAAKTIKRNFDWKNEETLFQSGLRVTTQNAKLWNNLGHVMAARGDLHIALEHFLKATEVEPEDIGGHLNTGTTYSKLGMMEKAEEAFWKAKSLFPKVQPGRHYTTHVAPRHLELFRHLGSLMSKNESRLEEAQQLYKEAISMKQDYTEAYLDRAGILIKLNRSKEARDAYNQALKHDSMNPDIFYNIGVLLLEEGDSQQALRHFDKALQINPEHEKSLINYAILSQEAGDSRLRRLAHERLQLLLDKGNLPPERIYFNMGMLAMEDREWIMAENYFKKAIQCKANFTSALFNMALLLHNLKRPLEAVPYLQVLLKHQEYHLKGLMLLGNIYFADMKNYYAAKECYETILSQNEVHIPALHNLCAVHVQLNELRTAEECLIKATELAPNEAYITEHLKSVREYQKRNSLRKSVRPLRDNKSFPRQCQSADCEDSIDVTSEGVLLDHNNNKV